MENSFIIEKTKELIAAPTCCAEAKAAAEAYLAAVGTDREDDAKTLAHAVLANEKMWDQDLTKIAGLEEKVAEDLALIRREGAEAAYASVLK